MSVVFNPTAFFKTLISIICFGSMVLVGIVLVFLAQLFFPTILYGTVSFMVFVLCVLCALMVSLET